MKHVFVRKIGLAVLATFSVFCLIGFADEITESGAAQVRPTASASLLASHSRPQSIESVNLANFSLPVAHEEGSFTGESLRSAPIFLATCVLRR